MEIALTTGIWRLGVALLGLLFFAGWEWARPFRPPTQTRTTHYLTNLTFAAVNAITLNILISSLVVLYYDTLAHHRLGLFRRLELSDMANLIASFVFLDFIAYVWHRAYHEWPLLWRLHKVHHSDRDLDVTSASRFHILEETLSIAFKMLVGLAWGPSALAMAVYEAALLTMAQFQHVNIKLPGSSDRWIQKLLVTPNMHRIHHSDIPIQTNSNYSNLFSIWDRMFGTYTSEENQHRIVFGLKGYPRINDVSLRKLFWMPFTAKEAAGETAIR
jgi:sterol desaturase/sphingolipid hydroxylase (fatty acid hydroxylase superfamily)